MSNNSKTVQDSYIYNGRPMKSYMVYRMVPFSMILNNP